MPKFAKQGRDTQPHKYPLYARVSPLLSLLTQLLCRKPMAFEDGKNLSLLERCRKRKERENKRSIVYPVAPPSVRRIRKNNCIVLITERFLNRCGELHLEDPSAWVCGRL